MQIPIIMTDSTKEFTVNLLECSQIESIYTHESSDIEVNVGTAENKKKYVVSFPSDVPQHFQFIVHWEIEGDEHKLLCERVVREGVYPTTERKLKEDKQREERDLEKLAVGLTEGIRIGPKGDDKRGTGQGSSGTTAKPSAGTGS